MRPLTNAKRGIGVAIAVVGVFVVLCLVLSFVFVPKNNTEECGMIYPEAHGFLGEPANTVDVVFVGDSEVFADYSPLQMWHEQGFTSYDAATPGQTLWYSKTMLDRVFTKQHPHLVVFELDALFRDMSLSDAILREVQDVLPVFEYHDRWKSLTAADFTSLPTATWTDPHKGFKLDANVVPADASVYDSLPTDEAEGLRWLNALWLRRLVNLCRSNGAIPVFVLSPSPANWSWQRHNTAQALADELGVDFLDLNLLQDELGIDWQAESTDGGDHVNLSGATKVSAYIGAHLAETYELADHRGDPDYARWDGWYNDYAKQVEELLR